MQVPEDHAFLKLVGFDWAKFRKSVVLPFAETFPLVHKGVLNIFWKHLRMCMFWVTSNEPMPN